MKYEYFILDERAYTYTDTGDLNTALLNDRLNAAAEEGYRLVQVYRNQLIMERPVPKNPLFTSEIDEQGKGTFKKG